MKSSESSQLHLVFADNLAELRSVESGADSNADESAGKSYLLHQARGNLTIEEDTHADDANRLLEQVASRSNLAEALLVVARNKGAAGEDGQTVDEVVERSAKLLPQIRASLLTGTYRPSDILRVWIPKPGGGERGLGIPNVIDRWVQQAVYQILVPILEPTFHDSSHGFRPDRGAHTALAEARGYFGEGYGVTVDIDLSKFFDRVHHQRLLGRLARSVGDGRILKLIHRMLKQNVVMPDGSRVSMEEGAPQGGPLSPLLSNVVLDELDWELSRRGLRFVRYADDFSVFVKSERSGRRVMESIGRFLSQRLRLAINEDKSSVSPHFDLTFLGFRLRKSKRGEIVVDISERTIQRLKVRIGELTPRNWGRSFAGCVHRINRYLTGWVGYFRLCTRSTSFSNFDAHIRRRLRALLVRQKKRSRHLYRHLLGRGVRPGMAWKSAYVIRGHWRRSASFGIHRAYSNAWFAERLVNLHSRWQELNAPRVPKQLQLFSDI